MTHNRALVSSLTTPVTSFPSPLLPPTIHTEKKVLKDSFWDIQEKFTWSFNPLGPSGCGRFFLSLHPVSLLR